jgi:DNA-binding MarR family transcriptional regulator
MKDAYDITVDPQTTAGVLINRVRTHLISALDGALLQDEEVATYGLSAAQFSVLSTLYKSGIENANELSKNLAYDRGAMSRMLDRLEAKHLIRRVRRDGERRTITLELTPEGEAAVPKMRACAIKVMNRFLRGIPKAEIRQLENTLQRILSNV